MKEPKLRFHEFKDEWQPEELNNVARVNTGKSITTTIVKNKDDKNIYPVIGSTGIIGYTDNYEHEGNFVLIARVGVNSGYVYSYNGKVSITDNTIFLEYDNAEFLKELLRYKKISRIAYGLEGSRKIIKASELKKLNIYIPSIDEQQKIGSFFFDLDKQIKLQSDKLETLKRDKKGYLQNMFPNNNHNKPKLRLNNFTDDWKTVELKSIANILRGVTYKPVDVANSGIRVLRSSDINNDVFEFRDDDVFIKKPRTVNAEPVNNGDILVTAANGSSKLVGKHAIVKGIKNYTVHGGFMLLIRSKYSKFINLSMDSDWYKEFIHLYTSGGNGSIGNLKKSDLEKQHIKMPSEEELENLVMFFDNLDKQIDFQRQKLANLKKQKEAYLQKMFI